MFIQQLIKIKLIWNWMERIKEITKTIPFEQKVIFNSGQIRYIEAHWKTLSINIRKNKCWKNIYSSAMFNRELTEKQWAEFKFLLKYGQTRYSLGILPKNY